MPPLTTVIPLNYTVEYTLVLGFFRNVSMPPISGWWRYLPFISVVQEEFFYNLIVPKWLSDFYFAKRHSVAVHMGLECPVARNRRAARRRKHSRRRPATIWWVR